MQDRAEALTNSDGFLVDLRGSVKPAAMSENSQEESGRRFILNSILLSLAPSDLK